MTEMPVWVASASITSAATKSTANISGIRFDAGTYKLRVKRRRGFERLPRAEFSTAAKRTNEYSSYGRHRQLPISIDGAFCFRRKAFACPAFPHNPQQPVDAQSSCHARIFGGF